VRGRLLRIAAFSVFALVAAGCQWSSFGFVASGNNSGETTIGVGNVGTLTAAWTAAADLSSSPTVAGGVVYVAAEPDQLEAFDARGTMGCSGAPTTCAPLWTATIGSETESTPAVEHGVVYVGGGDGNLYAFDAGGTKGCAGSPKTCAPLWTAPTGGSINAPPVVANGVVYVGSDDQSLYAFDAAGTQGCSGTPTTCAPLWTAPTGGHIRSAAAVASGLVDVGADASEAAVHAFDAAGSTGCSGVPRTCSPLWQGVAAFITSSAPAVVNGVLYIGSNDDRRLYAFDASGTTGCSGAPKLCNPLWAGQTLRNLSSPAVADGTVYIGSLGLNTLGINVEAFDASGTTGCSGAPKLCHPLWSTAQSSFVVVRRRLVAGRRQRCRLQHVQRRERVRVRRVIRRPALERGRRRPAEPVADHRRRRPLRLVEHRPHRVRAVIAPAVPAGQLAIVHE
jgi:outer membrane protein assembly factor BamB